MINLQQTNEQLHFILQGSAPLVSWRVGRELLVSPLSLQRCLWSFGGFSTGLAPWPWQESTGTARVLVSCKAGRCLSGLMVTCYVTQPCRVCGVVLVFCLLFVCMWAGVGVPVVSTMVTAPLGTSYSQRPNLCWGSLGKSRQQGPGAHRPLHPSESPSSVLMLLIGSPWWDRLGIACLTAARSLPLPRPCRRCCPALLSTSPSETRLPRSLFLEAARDNSEAGRGSGAVPSAVPRQGVVRTAGR